MASKVQRGYLYMTDGRIVKVRPMNGKKFELPELQLAVDGYIESVQCGIKGCRQMFANEDGISNRLPDNPYTWEVVNAKVYKANGYPPSWRIAGNIIVIKSEEPDEYEHPTVTDVITFKRAGRVYRGRQQKDADFFNFRRIV